MAEAADEAMKNEVVQRCVACTIPLARLPGHVRLRHRLAEHTPEELTTLGNLALLVLPKTGLFCSARCPGIAILSTYDQAARWRDTGRCVISGFHSPVEQECLRILLRGSQPIIVCPARTLPKKIPVEWNKHIEEGNMLILSAFSDARVTADLARRRNEVVAALSDDVWFAHITPGGKAERLVHRLAKWNVAVFHTPDRSSPQLG